MCIQWQVPNYVLKKNNYFWSKLHTEYNLDVILRFLEPLLKEFEMSGKSKILNQFQ